MVLETNYTAHNRLASWSWIFLWTFIDLLDQLPKENPDFFVK
jgi:hypothetical protein